MASPVSSKVMLPPAAWKLCMASPVSSGVMLPPAAWKLCQSLLVHGLTVAAVLNSDEWMHVPRDLDCVEIFAGVGSIAAAAAEKGLRSATYDKNRIPGVTEQTEDITTLQGFRGAIALVLRLVSYGLLWLAPDCSSWGFMNSSRCKRSEGNAFVGDVTYSKVIEGNAMAESSVFLILLAAARGVKAALENPGASQFFNYGPVVEMVCALNMVAACTYHCAFSVVPFGKRYKKKYKLLATSSWIRGVFAPCRCPGNLHLPLCNTRVGKNGQVQINGIKARLRESGAYPIAMGQRVVECACPGQADKDTAVEVAEGTLRKPTQQKKPKQVRRTLKKVEYHYQQEHQFSVQREWTSEHGQDVDYTCCILWHSNFSDPLEQGKGLAHTLCIVALSGHNHMSSVQQCLQGALMVHTSSDIIIQAI